MKALIDMLHTGNYSCVIKNGEAKTFTKRGVADLFDLINTDRNFLKGAMVADKVVGKAALALMIYGGVKELHAEVISLPALELLGENSNIKVTYSRKVPHIINRTNTDWCPLEKLCFDEQSVERMFLLISTFINEMRKNNG